MCWRAHGRSEGEREAELDGKGQECQPSAYAAQRTILCAGGEIGDQQGESDDEDAGQQNRGEKEDHRGGRQTP